MISVLLAGVLLAGNIDDIPIYDNQFRRIETIRPSTPNTYTIYDKEWRSTGTIKTHPDGSIDIYNPDSTRRFPTIRPSTPTPSPPAHPGRNPK